MPRLDSYRVFGALGLSLLVISCAQTSPTVELTAPALAPQPDPPAPQPDPPAQSPATANIAMAESAAVAMANITGVPTAAPVVPTPAPVLPTAAPSAVADGTVTVASATSLQPTPMPGLVEGQDCKVLAGTVGSLMQVVLFVCSLAALVFKYRRESGDRTPGEFVMDSSKQLIGAGWIHVLNILFAKGLVAHFQGGDECQWYFLNIILDCTLGVAVEYVLMRFLTLCIQRMYPSQADDLETGDYRRVDGTCNPTKYSKQLFLWILIVTLMKLCMIMIMTMGHTSLMAMAQAALAPFSTDATLKLFIVMIVTPVCMNVFQFWMVDNFIKRQSKGSADMSVGDLELDGSMRTRIQHGDM